MNKKGFTLIELLVVIAIIGLLSTMSVVALGSAREKSRDSKRLSDIKQVQTALELYYTDKGVYPIVTAATVLGSSNAACLNAETGFTTINCTDAYMNLIPADPGSNDYTYNSVNEGATYTIIATLEGDVNNLKAGEITATPSGVTNTETTPAS